MKERDNVTVTAGRITGLLELRAIVGDMVQDVMHCVLSGVEWWTAERVSAAGQVGGAVGTIGAFWYGLRLFQAQRKVFETDGEDRKQRDALAVVVWLEKRVV